MEILSIIPARNNSKGIPGKNIFPMLGKPLIAWNIEASKKSKYVTRTVVSTDGIAIADVAKTYGADVVMRPDELSGDTATSESALLHVLHTLEKEEGYKPDIIVFLQCTSPLTLSIDIDACVEKMLSEGADSATAVTDFHYFVWQQNDDGAFGVNHDKAFRPRRQDREPQYIETGAVYVMKYDGFLRANHRFFGKTVLSIMPQERVVEIDEPADIIIAESMMKSQQQSVIKDKLPSKIETLFFDFDGVMTDDTVIVDENGKEAVTCSREDGMGINMVRKMGIPIVVLSTESNPVVTARCKKLKIECYQNLGNTKVDTMIKYLEEKGISAENVIFMGNDVNDIACMKLAGCAVAPMNASLEAKEVATFVTEKCGGKGAVRELCNLILRK